MVKMEMALKLDPGLRAQFREVAREIITRDRQARALGGSQNTIGEIERALVRAYLAGRSHQHAPVHEKTEAGCVDWVRLPPRARNVLSSLLPIYGSLGEATESARLRRLAKDGRARWQYIDGRTGTPLYGEHTIADGGVAPLLRFGLLAAVEEDGSTLGLTERGVETVREYNRRSAANDPTLPKISLRPIGGRSR